MGGVALEARPHGRITRRRGEGADAVELIAGQEGLERGERHLRQENLSRAVADAEIRLPRRVLLEAVSVDPWMQCMRRGYSLLAPLKKRAVERRLVAGSRSVTSRAWRWGSCV